MASRRTVLKGGLAVGAIAATWMFKPVSRASVQSDYFKGLSRFLDQHDISRPALLVDLNRLDQNLTNLNTFFNRHPQKTYRIVVKSLPSPALLDYIARRTNTHAYMVFHLPFLLSLVSTTPDADILFGKPMPVASARHFYQIWRKQQPAFVPQKQLQWLIDSEMRLKQYLQLAQQQEQRLRVNLEIDVGLHRGGFNQTQEFRRALDIIAANPEHLQLSGLMGYDAHVSKLPGFLAGREFARVQQRYQDYIAQIRKAYPDWLNRPLCFNGAGSPTFLRYADVEAVNDLSVGSCLLKPSDFDQPMLDEYVPAAVIATRVLKKQSNKGIPTQEWLGTVAGHWDPNQQLSFFIYGGNWMATPCSPSGLEFNELYRSSNQQGLLGSADVPLDVDDWVFLRPMQSEAVLLQFGDLLAVRDGQLEGLWPILRQGASSSPDITS
ncbi:alanine racemase [Lacimicrobium alkaliphilum]|uniref:Alanine racemase N-terminal domain-containing protein n=1 Tax=Lacimicrobium alkaliphilum TaxID=1526571 RepID=A0ABQ1RRZ8_9ALTE|nr:alanine racemase [Lacimicrobium alkaliphilum]GGD79124.1 hypothetical protein GCM10011357_37690 [Lacimicrobium alkaliphilum]